MGWLAAEQKAASTGVSATSSSAQVVFLVVTPMPQVALQLLHGPVTQLVEHSASVLTGTAVDATVVAGDAVERGGPVKSTSFTAEGPLSTAVVAGAAVVVTGAPVLVVGPPVLGGRGGDLVVVGAAVVVVGAAVVVVGAAVVVVGAAVVVVGAAVVVVGAAVVVVGTGVGGGGLQATGPCQTLLARSQQPCVLISAQLQLQPTWGGEEVEVGEMLAWWLERVWLL